MPARLEDDDSSDRGFDPVYLLVIGAVLEILAMVVLGSSDDYGDDTAAALGLVLGGVGAVVLLVGAVALGVSLGIRNARRD